MNPSSRFERDPMSGAQQTSDESVGPGTGGQWDNPASTGQGKWENRQDDTDVSGGDTYTQQARYGAGGYNRDDSGQQRSDNWGQGTAGLGAGTTSDRYDTAGQYSSSDRFASDQTGGSADPSMGSAGQLDRDDGPASGGGGKPSATSKVMGTAERMMGKMTNDPGKQARGQERQEGMY